MPAFVAIILQCLSCVLKGKINLVLKLKIQLTRCYSLLTLSNILKCKMLLVLLAGKYQHKLVWVVIVFWITTWLNLFASRFISNRGGSFGLWSYFSFSGAGGRRVWHTPKSGFDKLEIIYNLCPKNTCYHQFFFFYHISPQASKNNTYTSH